MNLMKRRKTPLASFMDLKEKILQEDFQPVVGLDGDNISYIYLLFFTHRQEKSLEFQETGKLLDFYYEKGIKDKEIDKKKRELGSIVGNYLEKNQRKRLLPAGTGNR